jgi:peptidoglycan/LPS O-acetylase OafA/YrhL
MNPSVDTAPSDPAAAGRDAPHARFFPAMTRGQPTPLPVNNLDVLRAIAVLAVLVDHVLVTLGYKPSFVVWLGQAGVLAFFVHTSLVLMASLERDGGPARESWVRRFYVRRALRVYPLTIVVILLAVALRAPAGLPPESYTPRSLSVVMSNLALVQNLAGRRDVLIVLWTLPLEIQMYVVLPACFLIARRETRVWGIILLVAAGVGCSAVYQWGRTPAHPFMARLRLLEYVPCFLMGVVAYWLIRRRAGEPNLPAWTWPLIIAADVLLVGLAWVAWGHGGIMIALFCAVLGAAIPFVREASPSMFTRAANIIAVYSFGIYLLHMFALQLGFGVLHAQPLLTRMSVTALALCAWCFAAYHLIEKPGIAFARRILDRADRSAQTQTPSITAAV